MNKNTSYRRLNKVITAKETVRAAMLSEHKKELFGVPPSANKQGKLEGGTPPNMGLLDRVVRL